MPSEMRETPGGVQAMLRAPKTVVAIRGRARRVKNRAIVISNVGNRVYVDKDGQHPGAYKRSWHYRTGIRNGKAYARIWNDRSYAIFLEKGTRYMRAYRVLKRAMNYARS